MTHNNGMEHKRHRSPFRARLATVTGAAAVGALAAGAWAGGGVIRSGRTGVSATGSASGSAGARQRMILPPAPPPRGGATSARAWGNPPRPQAARSADFPTDAGEIPVL